ncbi:MAG TPA: high-affinity Fe2+/Pb2+ permease, partial [Isosphaeraceae bacterium]
MTRLSWLAMVLAVGHQGFSSARAGEVAGRVEMPAACSPAVSPAVVSLERLDGVVEMGGPEVAAKVALVNQRGLQFEPRVQAVQVGQVVRFTNEDNETHNVHILTPGVSFNQSMGRGRPVDYRAEKSGLLRIVCDVHSHMRGYVVVSPTPYYAVCLADGRFRLDEVPDGHYRVRVWHEMGRGMTRDIEVRGETPLQLGVLSVEAPPVQTAGPAGPARAWSDVIDRVGMLLGEARALAVKSGQTNGLRRPEADILPDDFGVESQLAAVTRARKLVEDAYWQEFEGSAMETAVRRHLGFQRAGEIEGLFR